MQANRPKQAAPSACPARPVRIPPLLVMTALVVPRASIAKVKRTMVLPLQTPRNVWSVRPVIGRSLKVQSANTARREGSATREAKHVKIAMLVNTVRVKN